MYKLLPSSIAVLPFLSLSVLAADVIDPITIIEPPVIADEGHNFEGAYVGILADYDFGKLRSGPATGPLISRDIESPYFGALAGLNVLYNGYIVGVEADVLSGGKSNSFSCSPTQICSERFKWTASLRGRIGVTHNKWMVYGTGGFAFAEATSTTTPPTGGTTGTANISLNGWTAGLGAEYAVTSNVRVKAEYLYTDYGTRSIPAGTISAVAYKANPKINSVRVGAIYGF